MQLDAGTLAKYESRAPELLDAVSLQKVPEGSVLPAAIMRRDEKTDVCVKFSDGWCGIHAARGTEFLGDACHFYPRVVRKVGEEMHQSMTMTLSCPEAARLMLLEDAPLVWEKWNPDRIPSNQRQYTPPGMSAGDALSVHAAFVGMVEPSASAATALLTLSAAVYSLASFTNEQWAEAAPMAIRFAPARIPEAERVENDPLNLLLAFTGLLSAANKAHHPRLRPMADGMARLIDAQLGWEPLGIAASANTSRRLSALPDGLRGMGDWVPVFFRRWLAAQLSVAFFPFAGFGDTLPERVSILGVRMATLALALLARGELQGSLSPEDAVTEAQGLSRFFDHLAEPEFSTKIYAETGWLRPARLRGLLESVGL